MVSASTRRLPSTTIELADWAKTTPADPTATAAVPKKAPARAKPTMLSPLNNRTPDPMRNAPLLLPQQSAPRRNRSKHVCLYRVATDLQTNVSPFFPLKLRTLPDRYSSNFVTQKTP